LIFHYKAEALFN